MLRTTYFSLAAFLAALGCGDGSSSSGGGNPPPPSTTTINFSTYLGKDAHDWVRDIAVDANGNVYAVGGAESGDLPTTAGTAQPTFGGAEDAFVAKFDAQGQLLWATFLGGAEIDRAYAVEVDGADVVIAGRAGASFPVTAGVIEPVFQGSSTTPGVYPQPQDGFVAKLDASDGSLVWSTFFGAANDGPEHVVRDVAIDPVVGAIYLAASTPATGAYPVSLLPAFQGTHQPNKRGGVDGVVAKLSNDGETLEWATYVGGSADEGSEPSLGVDSQGRPVVVYRTMSSNAPTSLGSSDLLLGGASDWYVAKYELDGDLAWATFVGGASDESLEAHNLVLANDDSVVVAGGTRSSNLTATVANEYDGSFNGAGAAGTGRGTSYAWDCGIVVLAPGGTALVGATYYGGPAGEACEGVDTDANRNVYVTGGSFSRNLPTPSGPYQSVRPGDLSPFLAVFNRDLTALRFATYFGGTGDASGRSIAVKTEARAVIGGEGGDGWPLQNAVRSAVSAGDLHGVVADLTFVLGPG